MLTGLQVVPDGDGCVHQFIMRSCEALMLAYDVGAPSITIASLFILKVLGVYCKQDLWRHNYQKLTPVLWHFFRRCLQKEGWHRTLGRRTWRVGRTLVDDYLLPMVDKGIAMKPKFRTVSAVA